MYPVGVHLSKCSETLRKSIITVLEIRKNTGCPFFLKSWATKPVNLVALMNPWLPIRKTYTFKYATPKNIHFCLLSEEIENLRAIMVQSYLYLHAV